MAESELKRRKRDVKPKLPGTTVHRETARKRKAAEAKRQAATEGAGGGKARGPLPKKGKGYAGDPGEGAGGGAAQKRMTRGGQEMPTGGGGPGPKMPVAKKGASPRRGGPSGDTRVSGGGPISAKVGGTSTGLPKAQALSPMGRRRRAPDVSQEVGGQGPGKPSFTRGSRRKKSPQHRRPGT